MNLFTLYSLSKKGFTINKKKIFFEEKIDGYK